METIGELVLFAGLVILILAACVGLAILAGWFLHARRSTSDE